MYIVTICFLVFGLINSEVNLNSLIKAFPYVIKRQDKDLNILRKKRTFNMKLKAFFIIFNWLPAKQTKKTFLGRGDFWKILQLMFWGTYSAKNRFLLRFPSPLGKSSTILTAFTILTECSDEIWNRVKTQTTFNERLKGNGLSNLRILTGKKHPKLKLQRLRKIWIWTFGSLAHQINSF